MVNPGVAYGFLMARSGSDRERMGARRKANAGRRMLRISGFIRSKENDYRVPSLRAQRKNLRDLSTFSGEILPPCGRQNDGRSSDSASPLDLMPARGCA